MGRHKKTGEFAPHKANPYVSGSEQPDLFAPIDTPRYVPTSELITPEVEELIAAYEYEEVKRCGCPGAVAPVSPEVMQRLLRLPIVTIGRRAYSEDEWDELPAAITDAIVRSQSRGIFSRDEFESLDSEEREIALKNSQRDQFEEDEWEELSAEDKLLLSDYADAADDLARALDALLSEINDDSFWEELAKEDLGNYLDHSPGLIRNRARDIIGDIEDLDLRGGDEDALIDRAAEFVGDADYWSNAQHGGSGDLAIQVSTSWSPDTDDVTEAYDVLVSADDTGEVAEMAFARAMASVDGYSVFPFDDYDDLRRHRYGFDIESPYSVSFDLDASGIQEKIEEEFPAEEPEREWENYYRHDLRTVGTFHPTLPTDESAFPWLGLLADGMFKVVELGSYEDLQAEARWLSHCLDNPGNDWPQRFQNKEYTIFSVRPAEARRVWSADYSGKQEKKIVWTLPHFTIAGQHHRSGDLTSKISIEHILGYHNREVGEGPSGASFRAWEVLLMWDALTLIANTFHNWDVDLTHGWESVEDFMRRSVQIVGVDEYELQKKVQNEYDVPRSFAENTVKAFFELLQPPSGGGYVPEGIENPAPGICPHCGGPAKGFCAPPGAGRRRPRR